MRTTPKRVLLTGPLGNVGVSIIMDIYKDQDERILLTCFDKQNEMSLKNYHALEQKVRDSFTMIWGDLMNPDDVERIVQDQDVILHVAAIIPPHAYQIPEIAKRVNVESTKQLLEACKKQRGKIPRFIFASSYSVYGPSNPYKNQPRLMSKSPTNAQDMYAKHKMECEKMIIEEYTGEWAILRLGAVSATKSVLSQHRSGKYANIFAFGIPINQHRHGVHSKDVARAFVNAAKLESSKVSGKIFLIGGDQTWCCTASGFSKLIFRALGLIYPTYAMRYVLEDQDDCFYYEEWMDTKEAQDLLKFQNHTMQDYSNELSQEIGYIQYSITRILSPFIYCYQMYQSPHTWYNYFGKPDPTSRKTFLELVTELDEH